MLQVKTAAPCNYCSLQASILSINQDSFKQFPTAQLGWGNKTSTCVMKRSKLENIETKNHCTGSAWPGRKMKLKKHCSSSPGLGGNTWLTNYHLTICTKTNPMFNYLPLYQSNPTQPTTNRKTKTDFGEDFNSADALYRCDRLDEYILT